MSSCQNESRDCGLCGVVISIDRALYFGEHGLGGKSRIT